MTWPIHPPRSAGVVAAVFVAAFFVAPPASHAQSGLLNLDPTTPQIQFDLTGIIAYDGVEFVVDAEPLAALFNLGPALVQHTGGVRDFVIRVRIDSTGNLVGGNTNGPISWSSAGLSLQGWPRSREFS
jgi:hypothetical protein